MLGWTSEALADPTCYNTSGMPPSIPCNDPVAYVCYNPDPDQAQQECNALGFTMKYVQGPTSYWYCPGSNGCGAAAVPELEDYAAAAFLVLALSIGWRVRRKHCPVT